MLKVVNLLLGLSVLLQMVTVFMMEVLHNYSLGKVHGLNGLIFFALVLAHVTLNFGWIKKNILGRK
jgi:hypothetical protein